MNMKYLALAVALMFVEANADNSTLDAAIGGGVGGARGGVRRGREINWLIVGTNTPRSSVSLWYSRRVRRHTHSTRPAAQRPRSIAKPLALQQALVEPASAIPRR